VRRCYVALLGRRCGLGFSALTCPIALGAAGECGCTSGVVLSFAGHDSGARRATSTGQRAGSCRPWSGMAGCNSGRASATWCSKPLETEGLALVGSAVGRRDTAPQRYPEE
jgi:hypothetical protein